MKDGSTGVSKRLREIAEVNPYVWNDYGVMSAASIPKLKVKWQSNYEEWKSSSLENLKIVYLWPEGVYVKAAVEKKTALLKTLSKCAPKVHSRRAVVV